MGLKIPLDSPQGSTSKPYHTDLNGVTLWLKVTPKASKNRIGNLIQDPDGRWRLKVFVTAPPEKGEANLAVIRLLSKTFKIAQWKFAISQGHTDNRKTMTIQCHASLLERALTRINE